MSRVQVQRALAEHVVRLVHGEDGVAQALRCTTALYGSDNSVATLARASDDDIAILMASTRTVTLSRDKYSNGYITPLDAVLELRCCANERDASAQIAAGALTFNGERYKDATQQLHIERELFIAPGRPFTLIRKARKRNYFIRWQ